MISVYIPSRGRPDRQITAGQLLAAKIPFKIVCSRDDKSLKEYKAIWGKLVVAVKAANLSEKRNAIVKLNKRKGKILMLDDDLTLFGRLQNGKFRKAKPADIVEMVQTIDSELKKHAHAGVADKFMSQHRGRGVSYQGRYSGILGYNLTLWPHGVKFRTVCNQEHDVHLQLATRGFPPAICNEFSRDNRYYAAGGCSKYRTPRFEAKEHRRLAKLWPELVRVVPNKNSRSGVGIRVKWKKAVEEGKLYKHYEDQHDGKM